MKHTFVTCLVLSLNAFALTITCEEDPVLESKNTPCLYSSPQPETKNEYVCACNDIPFGFTNDRTTKDVLVTTEYYHYDTKRCYGSDTFKTIDVKSQK